jgi:anaerobic magnesium-protoporphyrin IX monomethyl ester cyclase
VSDLLLSHGYFLSEDEKERQIMKPYPPLGLLYVAAYLKSRGVAVEIFDSTFGTRDELSAVLAGWTGTKVLGLYTNLTTRRTVVEVAERAKALGFTVVLGGPESANYPAEYLARGADVVVLGEGEETMAELLPVLSANGPHRLHGVAGTVFRDEEGRLVTNAARRQIENLDALPDPDREAIDCAAYVDVWRKHHGAGSLNLITARGCPYKCNWCSHAVFGFTHRRRSPGHVAEEVERIRDRYRPDQLWYADDVFTMQHGWLFAYARELSARGLRIPFETISRADRMMKEEVLETLAGMGCTRIWIGSESGSQRILDAMQRGVTVEQVRWATKAAQRHGIEVGMFLMWGYDGETLSDIEATIEHVKRTGPDVFLTTVSYPIRNTGYFEKVAGRVVLDRPWEAATDRDHRIAGRHSRGYYRHADRWLRSEIEAHRLEAVDPAAAGLRRAEARAARDDLLAADREVEA